MLRKPPACKECVLYDKGEGFTTPDGKGIIAIVGEAPGEREAKTGKPFVGAAGIQLNRAIERHGLERSDFSIYNLCQCRPPKNHLSGATYEKGAIDHCKVHFNSWIRRVKPKVISIQGALPMKHLLGITGLLPSQKNNAPKRGYVYKCSIDLGNTTHKCLAVPTMHPSFIIQGNQNLAGVHMFDVKRATKAMDEPPYKPNYILHPTISDIILWIEDNKHSKYLVADIETEETGGLDEEHYGRDVGETTITRISFSTSVGNAITIPFNGGTIPYIQRILSGPDRHTIWWNVDFDYPMLTSKGIKLDPTKQIDAMWAWHFLQSDVPKGLGFVSTFYYPGPEWKSLSESKPEYYSCVDADATAWNWEGISKQLKAEGRFDRFMSHCMDLYWILKDVTANGIKVDQEARREFRKLVLAKIDEANRDLQTLVPDACKPRGTKSKKGSTYSLPPLEFRCSACKGKGYTKKTRSREGKKYNEIKGCSECESKGYLDEQLAHAELEEGIYELSHDEIQGEDGVTRRAWYIKYPFNPKAPDDVKAYMRFKGHPIPKQRKKDAESTDQKNLERMAKKYNDSVYYAILEVREMRDIYEKYASETSTYEPQRTDDGWYIYPNFTFKPSTGRLASDNPNIQNVPKRGKLASGFRNQYVSRYL